ncbi:unnamed protein product, partial [Nesidiocoris tenuis]
MAINKKFFPPGLQVLANSSDSSIFDSDLQDTTHFYVNLHEIMSTLDRPSDVAWTAVNILHKACKNPTARRNLSEVYHFMPILTRLLSSDPSPDKEVILLQLMEVIKLLIILKEYTIGLPVPDEGTFFKSVVSTLQQAISTGNSCLMRQTVSFYKHLIRKRGFEKCI